MAGHIYEAATLAQAERHVNSWDVRVVRNFRPVYTFGGRRYDPDPFVPVCVEISVQFDDNDTALAFERQVRELLEKA
jgi:hypothetical protein